MNILMVSFCSMYWKVLKYFLLVNLAAAAPNGRHKRNFAHIKDFITSVLFDDGSTDIPDTINLKPDQEYQFYKIPGYDNILIKASPIKTVIRKVNLNKPGQMLDIQPFESFLGTKNVKDTLEAFENVNNLLSTEIFNEEENNTLKETITPMVADTLKFMAEDHIKPLSKVSEAKSYKINKDANELEDKKKHLANNKDFINDATIKEGIEITSLLPNCSQRRKDEIVSYSEIAIDGRAGNNKYLNAIDQFSSDVESSSVQRELDSSKDRKTQKKVMKHLFDLNAVDDDLLYPDPNIKRIQDKIATEKISLATASHSISTTSIPIYEGDSRKYLGGVANVNRNATYMATSNNTNKIHTEIITTKENNSEVERYSDNQSIKDNASSHINKQPDRNNSQEYKVIKEIDQLKDNISTNSSLTSVEDLTPVNTKVVADIKVNHQNKFERNYNGVKESGYAVHGKEQTIKGRGDIPEDFID